jgi:hypothetical protein
VFGGTCTALYAKTHFHSKKTPQPNFRQLAIQEPAFSVSNTEFEGGGNGNGRGHGDSTFFGQRSPTQPYILL